MSDVEYVVDDSALWIKVPFEKLKELVEHGMAAEEIKRYNGGRIELLDANQLALDMARNLDQFTCGEPGQKTTRVIDEFLDQTVYATIEFGTDSTAVT